MWPFPRILAHRGAGTLAPENTLAAFRCGLAHGFHAVEFDVMLSKDRVPVLMHDPGLGRTVSGAGSISAFTAAELSAMDAGRWFGPAFAGEPVPLLADVIAFCRAHRIWMNIEIKPVPGFERETGETVGRMVQQCFAGQDAIPAGGARLPLLSSFSFDALGAAKAAAPGIPRGLLMDRLSPDWHARLQALGAVSLHTNHLHISREQVKECTQAGYGMLCYTVNDPARAREILDWGVDAFCTDRIDLIGPDFS